MEWRVCVGFPGYEVSDTGLVRGKRGWILKTAINSGYHLVSIASTPWIFKTKRVHRLVAEAFLANPGKLPEVDHIDRNRSNNTSANLRWVGRKENSLNQSPRMTKPQLIKEVFELCKMGFTERQIQAKLRDISSWLRLNEASGRVFKKRLRSVVG